MKRYLKPILGGIVMLVTISLFVRFISQHRELLDVLGKTSIWQIMLLLGLYGVWFLGLVLILRVSIRMFNIQMGKQENILLNAYSSLVNFFGPGQSGPAVRGLYLKKRHGMRIKDYIFTTLIYYGFYALISALFIGVGSFPWWATIPGLLAVSGASYAVIAWYGKRSKVKEGGGINPRSLSLLFGATLLQMLAQLAIYAVELHSTSPGASLSQLLTYTGAANFSLFVALTPGAIGIREGFLVVSQHWHHITSTAIVAANVIDRAVYILFLGLLFILVLTLHAKAKLNLRETRTQGGQSPNR